MRSALLLLDCARALRHSPDEIPSRVSARTEFFPRAFLEIVEALRPCPGGRVDPAPKSVQLPVIFLVGRGGEPATLELELMRNGSNEFYPAVEMVLASWDGAFAAALASAHAFLKARRLWPAGCDIRWRIRFLNGPLLPFRSHSLGAAFAFGAARLAAEGGQVAGNGVVNRLCSIRYPSRVCLSGAISENGLFDGIVENGVPQKIAAALSCPTISTLILPRSALPRVEAYLRAHRTMGSASTFRIPRGSGAAPLTLLLESAIL